MSLHRVATDSASARTRLAAATAFTFNRTCELNTHSKSSRTTQYASATKTEKLFRGVCPARSRLRGRHPVFVRDTWMWKLSRGAGVIDALIGLDNGSPQFQESPRCLPSCRSMRTDAAENQSSNMFSAQKQRYTKGSDANVIKIERPDQKCLGRRGGLRDFLPNCFLLARRRFPPTNEASFPPWAERRCFAMSGSCAAAM
jgi:hypothetical protein